MTDAKSLMNVFITNSTLKTVNNNINDDEMDLVLFSVYHTLFVRVILFALKSHCPHQQVNERLQERLDISHAFVWIIFLNRM